MTVNLGAPEWLSLHSSTLKAQQAQRQGAEGRRRLDSRDRLFLEVKGMHSPENLINDHFIIITVNWVFQERGWVRFLGNKDSTCLSDVSVGNWWPLSPGITRVGRQLNKAGGHSWAISLFLKVTKYRKTLFLGSDCIYKRVCEWIGWTKNGGSLKKERKSLIIVDSLKAVCAHLLLG